MAFFHAFLLMSTLAALPQHDVVLTLAQPDREGWPERVTIAIVNDTQTRRLEIAPKDAFKPQRLQVPPGEYTLIITAAHHRELRESLIVGSASIDLGTRALRQNPVISGVVRAKGDIPLQGALVRATEELSAITDAVGRFELEVDKEWPRQLRVSYGGLATKSVDVPREERSVVLRAIELPRGGSLHVRVDVEAQATVELRRAGEVVASKTEKDMDFTDLEAGEMQLVVRGEEPLERYATTVRIGEGVSAEKRIAIEPLPVTIEVVRGTNAVAGALLEVMHQEYGWSAKLTASDSGRVQANAWQAGDYLFAVRSSAEGVPFIAMENLDGKSGIRIALPDRTIRGRVVDSITGTPVPAARLKIESENDDGTGTSFGTNADATGAFTIDALASGTHTLSASADGYLASEVVAVRLANADHARDVILRLRKTEGRTIAVFTRAGLPVRGASVIQAVNGTVQGVFTTNDRGEAIVRDAASVVYVIPREGSFVVARLAMKEERTTITVPDGVASLELRTVDSEGKAIPHVRFLMRVDGELIPPDVQHQLERMRAYAMLTNASGALTLDFLPAGFYELWPVRAARELEDTLASVGESAPVQVSVKPGRNTASLTFARR